MRLFVAIELDAAVRSALKALQDRLRVGADGVRWVRIEQVHLTVKFLGEQPDDRVPRVCEAVAGAAAAAAPLAFDVTGCGVFPPRGKVRVVWAGVRPEDDRLARCFASLESALDAEGIPREPRPFSPHITLGRVRDDRSGGRLRAAVDGTSFAAHRQTASSITLMSSVLGPGGPAYAVVKTAHLGGALRSNG